MATGGTSTASVHRQLEVVAARVGAVRERAGQSAAVTANETVTQN